MNSEVAGIIDDSARTSAIDTRLQWAQDRIAGWHNWELLQNYEDRTITLDAQAITGSITAADPAQVTLADHGIADGTVIAIQDASGMVEINNRLYTTANAATNTFELSGENSTNHTAHTSASGVVKQAIFARPTALRSIETIRLIRIGGGLGHMLEHKDGDSFDDDYPQPSQQGPPKRWTQKGATFQIDPLPTTDEHGYYLYCTGQKTPTAFTADSDTSGLHENLDEALILLASSMMYQILEEEGLSEKYKQFARESAAEVYRQEVAFGAQ